MCSILRAFLVEEQKIVKQVAMAKSAAKKEEKASKKSSKDAKAKSSKSGLRTDISSVFWNEGRDR